MKSKIHELASFNNKAVSKNKTKIENYNHSGLGSVTIFFALLTAGFIIFNIVIAITQ